MADEETVQTEQATESAADPASEPEAAVSVPVITEPVTVVEPLSTAYIPPDLGPHPGPSAPTADNYGFFSNCEILVSGDTVTVVLDSAFPGCPEGIKISLHKAQVAAVIAHAAAGRLLNEPGFTLFTKPAI